DSRIEANTLWPARAKVSAVSRPKPVLVPVIRIVLGMIEFLQVSDLGLVGVGRQFANEKVADERRYFWSAALQRKMAGIEQMDFGFRVVAFERLGAGSQKERIVSAPDREQR